MHKSLIGCVFTLALAASAQAADVDWKMYGTASIDGGVICFYDAKGVARTADNNVRVWTKCLLQKDLNNLDGNSELGKKIVESSAQKVIKGYVPPIVALGDMEFDQIAGIVPAEETANLINIQPHSRIFYELNCSERMATSVRINGKVGFEDMPSNWEHIAPESNGARLLKILCR